MRITKAQAFLIKAATLFFLLLICIDSANSQTGTIKVEKPNPETPKDTTAKNYSPFLNIYYGYKLFFQDFQGRVNTTKKVTFGRPVQTIGIGPSGYFAVSRGTNFHGHFLYNYVLPQTFYVNDSLKCKISGFTFSAAFGGGVYTKSKKALMMFYLGFNTGRIRFHENNYVRQKNPFFSPKIGIQPKLIMGRFSVTLIAEAEYDVTKTGWKWMRKVTIEQAGISKFRQSGITTLIGVCYSFINYATSDIPDPDPEEL